MLGDFAVLLIAAVLVNNFVLVQFLGLCPFMGVSNKLDTAIGMSAATTFVLTLASVCSFLTYRYLLEPLDLTYLRTLSFILVIAVVVQFTEMVVRKTSPLLHRVLGVYCPSLQPTAPYWVWHYSISTKRTTSWKVLSMDWALHWAFPWYSYCSRLCASDSW